MPVACFAWGGEVEVVGAVAVAEVVEEAVALLSYSRSWSSL